MRLSQAASGPRAARPRSLAPRRPPAASRSRGCYSRPWRSTHRRRRLDGRRVVDSVGGKGPGAICAPLSRTEVVPGFEVGRKGPSKPSRPEFPPVFHPNSAIHCLASNAPRCPGRLLLLLPIVLGRRRLGRLLLPRLLLRLRLPLLGRLRLQRLLLLVRRLAPLGARCSMDRPSDE